MYIPRVCKCLISFKFSYFTYDSIILSCRPVEPSHQLATAILPTNKPSVDHTHALSLSECSSLSSFVAQDQVCVSICVCMFS